MHYHIDAWIWATEHQLRNVPEGEKPETRKFLEYRKKAKADGCTKWGISLAPGVPLAPDMIALIALLDAWTAGHRKGYVEGMADNDRSLQESHVAQWIKKARVNGFPVAKIHPLPSVIPTDDFGVKAIMAILRDLENGRCAILEAPPQPKIVDDEADDYARRKAYSDDLDDNWGEGGRGVSH